MNYLIICKSEGKHYLLMNKEGENFAIKAYRSKEDVMDSFKGYTESWTRDATWSASATIGMMSMQPVAIEAPDNVDEIKPFIIKMTITHITGGAMNGGYYGLEVNEDILSKKQFDIWKESMVLGGIA
jgi:hypothetical protein